jgi:arylsulfatase A-like enzyme
MRWILAAICVTTFVEAVRTAEPVKRPNVLFIAVDDLRPEFGAYGAKHVKSPNLDRLAARGVTFNHAYCQQAVCSPSRSSVLTGCRPDTTKVHDLVTHFRKALPDIVALPQLFKQNGYHTQGMGKIYHSGFDDVPSWSAPSTVPKGVLQYGSAEARKIVKDARESLTKEGKQAAEINRLARGPAFESADAQDSAYHDGALADMAIDALGKLKEKKEPFFLAVGFLKPHLPFVAPKKYWDLYDPARIELAKNPYRPKNAPAFAIEDGGELRSYHGIPKGHLPDDLARQLKHGYYAAISYMDAQLGRVLDELDRLGLAENTIVVLWGDHGWKLGEHDAWCKHSNTENDTNAPLLIAVPGMKTAGKKSDSLVEFVDIYPTIADLCGLTPPKHLEGESLVPLLTSPEMMWKLAAFSQYPRVVNGKKLMGYSMRTADNYRFTRWVERDQLSKAVAMELYNHKVDPAENDNIVEARPKDDIDTPNSAFWAAAEESFVNQWKAGWRGAFPTIGPAEQALASAKTWELVRLEPNPKLPERIQRFVRERTPWYAPFESPEERFHNWQVTGRTKLDDPKAQREILAALNWGIREIAHRDWSERDHRTVRGRCFNPRHGIRAMVDGRPLDLVICFECGQMEIRVAETVWRGSFSPVGHSMVDSVFGAAGLPALKDSQAKDTP